jgi:hypothetical protein
MVVKRKAPSVSLAPVAEAVKEQTVVTKHTEKLNRVRLIGGYGPDGFKTSRSAGHAKVTTDNSVLGGLGYDRVLGKDVSVGGLILSNGTAAGSVGLDF